MGMVIIKIISSDDDTEKETQLWKVLKGRQVIAVGDARPVEGSPRKNVNSFHLAARRFDVRCEKLDCAALTKR